MAVFLDMTKAYEFVSHDIMLEKLEILRIRGNTHRWFKSYLTQRMKKFVVEQNGICCYSERSSEGNRYSSGKCSGPNYVFDIHE